jgi:hypothetical protein
METDDARTIGALFVAVTLMTVVAAAVAKEWNANAVLDAKTMSMNARANEKER